MYIINQYKTDSVLTAITQAIQLTNGGKEDVTLEDVKAYCKVYTTQFASLYKDWEFSIIIDSEKGKIFTITENKELVLEIIKPNIFAKQEPIFNMDEIEFDKINNFDLRSSFENDDRQKCDRYFVAKGIISSPIDDENLAIDELDIEKKIVIYSYLYRSELEYEEDCKLLNLK